MQHAISVLVRNKKRYSKRLPRIYEEIERLENHYKVALLQKVKRASIEFIKTRITELELAINILANAKIAP